MARTIRTETRKSSAGLIFIFVFLMFFLVAGILFAVKELKPDLWSSWFPSANDTLVRENQQLKNQLNSTETELGQTKAALFQSQSSKVAWTVVICVVVVAVLALLFYAFIILPKDSALTIEQFEQKFLPLARKKFDFPEEIYPYYKFLPKTVERKEAEGNNNDELTYYGEFSFYEAGENNLYVKGIHAALNQTVTVAITNKSWRYRQKWYEWMNLDSSMKFAAEEERRGHGIQKSRLKSDIEDALAGASNIGQLKDAFVNKEMEDA